MRTVFGIPVTAVLVALGSVTLGSVMLAPLALRAGEADVVGVEVVRNGERWRFDVTVKHADTGWDHYADEWRVVAPDGTVLGTRTLHHPHVNEQPFTRSLSGVVIPDDLEEVIVQARDSVHGYGGVEMRVALPRE